MRAKYVVFAVILLMMGYVANHNERFVVEPQNPAWEHYGTLGWWFVLHTLAGASALLLAPLQFSDRLRRRYPKVHRIVGRIYVAGAFILAPFGAYMQYLDEGVGLSRTFTVASTVDATLLMVTTGIAFAFALRGRIAQHRQWMTRSYAVALVFFEVRVILGITGWETLGPAVTEAVVWGCLACSLLLADLANHWQEIGSIVRPVRTPVALKAQPT